MSRRKSVGQTVKELPATPVERSTPAEPARPAVQVKSLLLGMLILVIAVFIAYAPSLKGDFMMDDNAKIVRNPDIQDWGRVWSKLIYPYTPDNNHDRNDPSRPVVSLTLAWNYHLSGLNPVGYHLFNVVFHLLNAMLLWLILMAVWRGALKDPSPWFPLLGALLFAIHPMLVSTVAYAFSRSDILCTFFIFSTLLLFLQIFGKPQYRWLFLSGALICAVLSLFSKQSAVVLPVALLLFDLVVMGEGSWKAVWQRKYYHLAFWVLIAGYLGWRIAYFGSIGDMEAATTCPRMEYILSQPYSIIRYFQLLLIPLGYCPDHRFNPITSFFQLRSLLPWTVIIGLAVSAVLWYRKRTPSSRVGLLMMAWYFLWIAPTSSFFPTTALLVENRVYTSGFGWAGLMALGYYLWATYQPRKVKWPLFAIVAALQLLLLFSVCIARSVLFGTPRMLWESTLALYPSNSRALAILGNIYQNEGEDEKALQAFQMVVKMEPKWGEFHAFMAMIYSKHGAYDQAITEYQLETKNSPNDYRPHAGLANVYQTQKRYPEALNEYQIAIQMNPNNAHHYYGLGTLFLEIKQFDQAIAAFSKSLELLPEQAQVYNNLGAAYYQSHRYDDARREFEHALQINPAYKRAATNLQRTLKALGRSGE